MDICRFRISKADGNTEIYFGIDDKFQYNFKSGLDVIHLVNKAVIGDRSQPYGGSDEPITTYQLKVHMLGMGSYRHTKDTYNMLYHQGEKYITNPNTITPKTGVSFENPEIYDGLDTVSLNGSFISKSGIRPLSYSYADKSYSLDKAKLFEYDLVEGKHVYGSYDGLMGMSDTKGKLIYDFDLKQKGTLSIRVKPLVSSVTDRTIIMNKKDGTDLFGAVLKTNDKLYMVLNGASYPTNGITVPTSGWFTVVLKWDGTQYSVIADGTEIPAQTMTTSIEGAQTIVGSNIDGQQPVNHLNGQLELLAYKDDILDTGETSKLFQTNHMISIKTHVDILGRSKKDVIDTGLVKLENEYTYKAPATGRTSLQVESITKYDQSVVSYEYDALGNVIHMFTPDGTYKYEYDYLNRLIREFNPVSGLTMIMAYTGNNNILSKKYYNGDHPLDVNITPYESYEYHYDTVWKDRLIEVVKKVDDIEVDTTNITYDSNFIGNPSQIGDKVLSWKGRNLTNVNTSISYGYDENGSRLFKNINGNITTFEYVGKRLVSQKNGNDSLIYMYNEKGTIIGFEYHKKQYFYVKDILDIITEIIDENGNVMVSYKYDAWGNIIHKNISNPVIDEVNHFVYKGYFLDDETGWYYLKNRYYSPILGRFVSSDGVISVKNNVIDNSLFTYCVNNPVMYLDSTGHSWESFWKTAFGVAAGIAIGTAAIVAIVASGGTLLIPALIGLGIGAGVSLAGQGIANISGGKGFFENINWMSVAMGGISGFAFATGVGGLFGAIGIGALSSAGSSAFEGESWKNIGMSGLLGGAAAGIGYGVGKFLGNQVFKNSDLVFNDIFQITRLDTNIVNSAIIAFRATWYTFIPTVTPGIARGIIKYLGN